MAHDEASQEQLLARADRCCLLVRLRSARVSDLAHASQEPRRSPEQDQEPETVGEAGDSGRKAHPVQVLHHQGLQRVYFGASKTRLS